MYKFSTIILGWWTSVWLTSSWFYTASFFNIRIKHLVLQRAALALQNSCRAHPQVCCTVGSWDVSNLNHLVTCQTSQALLFVWLLLLLLFLFFERETSTEFHSWDEINKWKESFLPKESQFFLFLMSHQWCS